MNPSNNGILRTLLFLVLSFCFTGVIFAEDGYRLWLRYDKIQDAAKLGSYREHLSQFIIPGTSPMDQAIKSEVSRAMSGLLGNSVPMVEKVSLDGAVIISLPGDNVAVRTMAGKSELEKLGPEGYLIKSVYWQSNEVIIVTANSTQGLLYGTFALIRQIQTGQSLEHLYILEKPRLERRLLNHWDNPDGSIERGYSGRSIWNWAELPGGDHTRYTDYARANASIGINGAAINNVNSRASILSTDHLKKVVGLADTFRPYGIKVFLSIKFSTPVELNELDTADPLDPKVQQWWNKKADEIYSLIPDFGGFLVKAYSEGQPGPQNYGRSHADGANMLATALEPHGGIVMWRAFVYDVSIDPDRFKCGYLEFVPLDGKFKSNVFVQPKNGPIDFQPLEPYNPLFGSMPKTPLMMEIQITQEYTGQARHLVYQAPMWREVLMAETFSKGPGVRVADILEGTLDNHKTSGIAAVAAVGQDRNWTGHDFTQANWYSYGRLAWNSDITSDEIAREWVRMTWSEEPEVVEAICNIMSGSWRACVNYMTPLGLAHIMSPNQHYGPGPDHVSPVRPDWGSTYYHKASIDGIGFDRTESGSNALGQYYPPLRKWLSDPKTTPVDYLLWYHHLPWDWKMPQGNTLWEEMQIRYQSGVDYVAGMQKTWDTLEGKIDRDRFEKVKKQLEHQYENACQWRDVCLGYFGDIKDGKRK